MSKKNQVTSKTTSRRKKLSPCDTNTYISSKDRQKGISCDLNRGIWEENQEFYERTKILQESGRIFNSSEISGDNIDEKKLFHVNGRFLSDPLYKHLGKYTTPTTPTTYIYIISKVFDDDIYFKVGEGGKGSSSGVGRLGDAQTYLSPGLENAGYKVHYVFFFRKNLHNNSVTIGQHIEKKIHKVLRYYFKPTNISHTNDEPSEWYLLKNSKEEIFFFGICI